MEEASYHKIITGDFPGRFLRVVDIIITMSSACRLPKDAAERPDPKPLRGLFFMGASLPLIRDLW